MDVKVGSAITDVTLLNVGDIVAIPLSNGVFGFARIFRDSLGVCQLVSKTLRTPEEVLNCKVAFFVGYFCTRVQECDWIYLGCIPFRSDDEYWPPPMALKDVTDPTVFRIYHRGRIRQVAENEVRGLDAHVMQPPEIIRKMIEERIVKFGASNEH